MTEPLTDEKLRSYAELLTGYAGGYGIPGPFDGIIRSLIAEVERLKAALAQSENLADADESRLYEIDTFAYEYFRDAGRPMDSAVTLGETALCLKEELNRLTTENAALRRELETATAASHGRGSFLAGMRTKGMEGSDD